MPLVYQMLNETPLHFDFNRLGVTPKNKTGKTGKTGLPFILNT